MDLAFFLPACFALNLTFGPSNLLALTHGAQTGIRFAFTAALARLAVFAPMIAASALGLGLLIGLPAAVLTGRLSPGEPQLTEALGVVFLTAGLAVWAEVSFLLAGMAAGAVIANRAHHHERAFHEIEHIRWPFMILFFVLAGASLEPGRVAEFGLVAAGYVVLRIAGRLAGGWIGGALAEAPATQRPWYGVALLPQAGVAVGMALIAAREFPDHGELILGLAVATTVVFEVIGPLATLLAVRRTERTEDTERG